jgi:hypothetical protein
MEIEASIPPTKLRAEKLCHQYALRMLSFSESHSLRKALQLRNTGTSKIEFSLFVVFSRAFYFTLRSIALTLRELYYTL